MKYKSLKPSTAEDWLRDECKSGCEHPFKKYVYDYSKKMYVEKELDCGKCLHCRQKQQNQWVKRMQYESHPTINKNAYFITLTYSPEFLKKNKDYREDTYSLRVHGDYLPLLLCRKHLQLFFQRLRNNNKDKKFTYYGCGEYGDNYSRPHFHAIIWSNEVFTTSEIQKAWSVRGQEIGLIEVDDLVANGTLSDLRSDSPETLLKSSMVSRYICKYVNKLDRYPLHNMFTEKYINRIYKRDFIKTKKFDRPLNRDCTHINNSEHKHIKQLIDTYGEEFKEYKKYDPKDTEKVYEYKTVEEFFAQFLPYTICSKDYAIGSRYLEQYVKGEDDLCKTHYDKYTGDVLFVPRSLKRKVLRQVAPILPCSKFTYNTTYEDLIRVPDIFKAIRNKFYKVETEDRMFNYVNMWLFTDRQCFYQVKSSGEVNIYDYDTSEYLETIGLDVFEPMLNLDHYFDLKSRLDLEYNEYIQSKLDYLNRCIEVTGHQQDYAEFRREVILEQKREIKLKEQNNKFRRRINKL